MPFSSNRLPLAAKTFHGLEPLLAGELKALGAGEIVLRKRAVEFTGDLKILYEANLRLRTALKILRPLANFRVTNDTYLYRHVQKIDWSEWITPDSTLAIDSTVHSRYFNHSKYVALKTKDAIVDQLRSRHGRRPSVNVEQPDVRIHVHIAHDDCTIAVDSSGQSLHRRGYRLEATEAPLNEILAAALVLFSGWNGADRFLDPMCGSGTMAIEAGLIGTRTAPGLLRKEFGFMKWPDYDEALWKAVRRTAEGERTRDSSTILARDTDGSAVELARRNVQRAGLGDAVEIEKGAFEDMDTLPPPATLILNPPYGERLKETDLHALYERIGDTLKKKCQGSKAWIITANKEALKHVGLKASQKKQLFNGALACVFAEYDLYAGSRRPPLEKTEDQKQETL